MITTSHIRRPTLFEPTDPNVCMWGGVTDVIISAKLFESWFEGSGAGRPGCTISFIRSSVILLLIRTVKNKYISQCSNY